MIERLIDIAAARIGFDRDRAAPAQSHRRRRSPTPTPLGMTYDSGDYADAWTARWRSPTGRASPSAGAKPTARRQLRGIGLGDYLEITSGAPRECAEVTVQPEGAVEVVDRHAVERPGPRDELRPMRRRMARRRRRQHQADPGRHRHRAGRRRLAFRPLDADGRHRHGQGLARRSSRRPPASPATCWRPTEADVAFAEGRFTVKGTDRSIGLFEAARPRASGTICPTTCAGRSPPRATS